MACVQLQDAAKTLGHLGVDPVQIALHLEAHAGIGAQAHGMAAQLRAELHLADLSLQHAGHIVRQLLEALRLLLRLLLLLVAQHAEVVGEGVAEGLLFIGPDGPGHEFVHLIRQQQDIVALAQQHLHLGLLCNAGLLLAGGVVDLLLALGHGLDVFLQGDELLLLAGPEEGQVLQQVLMAAKLRGDADLELTAEGGEKFLVLLPVVLQHFQELRLDLLFQITCNQLELAVVLEHLAGDVQAQILGVHHALDEAEVLRQQVGAVLIDQHAGRIELQALFIVGGIEIVWRAFGDEQQGLVGQAALHAGIHRGDGVLEVHELLLVEFVVLLLAHVLFGPLPQGHHGVEGLVLDDGFPLGLLAVLGPLLPLLRLHLHADRIADIVGILLDQGLDLMGIIEAAVALVLGVVLDLQHHVGAHAVALAFRDSIAVGAGGLPHIGLLLAVLLGNDGHMIRRHKGGVEAHAELADDIHVVGLVHFLLELQAAGLGDGAEVLLQLLLIHADAIVGHGQNVVLGIALEPDLEVAAAEAHLVVGQAQIGQLVDGVGRVGYELTQEDLLVGIDGIDHQIEQALGFRLELFLCHVYHSVDWISTLPL